MVEEAPVVSVLGGSEPGEIVKTSALQAPKKAPLTGPGRSFTVTIEATRETGLVLDDLDARGPVIASIPEGAVQDFNMKNPASAVCPNDLILAVNAVEGEVKAIIQQLQSLDKTPLTLKILRPQEMKISMGKKPNASLGLQMNFSSFSAGAVVDMIAESGVAYGWNESQPEEKRLRRGDRLVAIDGQYLKGEEMIEALKQKKGQECDLDLTILRY